MTRGGTNTAEGPEACVVLCTAPDEDAARRIAYGLVERRVAACVNLVPGLTSVYRWQGRVEEATEILLVAKTTPARLAELEAAIVELHPYDTPEIVALRPTHVAARYLAWLAEETR